MDRTARSRAFRENEEASTLAQFDRSQNTRWEKEVIDECAHLGHGFLRSRCESCHDEKLVAFRCDVVVPNGLSRPSLVPDICPTRCDIVRHSTPLLRANTYLKVNKINELKGLVHNGIVEVVGSKPSGSTNQIKGLRNFMRSHSDSGVRMECTRLSVPPVPQWTETNHV